MKHISVGTDEKIWGIDLNDVVNVLPEPKGVWQKIEGTEKVQKISVGYDGRVWGLIGSNIVVRDGIKGEWKTV